MTEHDSAADVERLATQYGTTLSEVLAARARLHGDRTVLRFVDYSVQRAGVERTLTFSELNTKVTAAAATLATTLDPGDRVAVLAPQGLEFIVGFLAALRAGLVAVPLFSPDLPGHGDRLTAVVSDCAPAVALATTANATSVGNFVGSVPVVILDEIDDSAGADYVPPTVEPQDLAYLQYTSGSTRLPAGVRITHRNVVVNAAAALVAGQGTEDSTLVSWLPLFHDMGLVFVVGGSVVGGIPSVLIDPIAFLMKPVRWLQQLSNHPRSFTAAPNFAFDFCAKKVSAADRAALDLSDVMIMFNGAEPVLPHTLTRFYDVFEPHGLRRGLIAPSYGLAESTVYVASMHAPDQPQWHCFDLDALSRGRAEGPRVDSKSVDLVVCGLADGGIAIADPATGTRLADGLVGEIWLNNDSVGDGYWNRPEQSGEVFGQILLEAGELASAGWLRTGDLGVVVEGRLFVTGRIKDLIIIDGRNHYPHDLELTVEEADEVVGRHRTAAFSVPGDGGEQAVVVAEVSRHRVGGDWTPGEVTRRIAAAVSREHGVAVREVVLIDPDTIPRTTSGKIARAASRTAYLGGTLSVAHGQD